MTLRARFGPHKIGGVDPRPCLTHSNFHRVRRRRTRRLKYFNNKDSNTACKRAVAAGNSSLTTRNNTVVRNNSRGSRQHLLGEEPQAPLGHLVGGPAEAEGDVELEIADDLPAFFQPAQDLVGRAPARRLHEAVDRALEAALARDLRLLLVRVVALHG